MAIAIWSCSPKTSPVTKIPTKPADNTANKQTENKAGKDVSKPVKKASDRYSTIALILPFGLDHLNPGGKYSSAGLKKASLALDYYRGFKLALDSLTADGANFRVLVNDSKDEPAQSRALALNPQIRTSDLVVGPVFPDGMKSFVSVPNPGKKLILSPLSPAAPATYNDSRVITIIPPLEYHARRAAEFVNDKAVTKKVFILTSGYSDEQAYISYFKKAIDSLSKKKIKVIQYTVSRGNLKPLIPQMTKFNKNFVVIPSTQQNFLKVTLYSLDTLSRQYPMALFGHPKWEKFTFLKAEQMQRLNAHITSADNVNYKSVSAITFIRNYRKAYHAEPSDYAIKAFDEGLFFGQILADDPKKLEKLDDYDFTGLHNSFKFIKKGNQGWVNTHVDVLKYANFELKLVE
ncbi:amino acid ABC transporter substrate-binding protein [Mucilaginibacter limnophilus]|uniref:Amino acid ABC transporter substrate-binding protein n=1 Tax=Mucilaginibacter limnophilus TaxID=1932778 RepID=A0A437MQ90_9SPHI|nr:ABC transporter substrate-binding protein [Mucilaginibacter limnophilus]RVT99812.1 amino acid ABC transporter substrate-binding protein [Mucilaginibacter limnophilus]